MLREIRIKLHLTRSDMRGFYLEKFHKKPNILSNRETIDKIIESKSSIGRFGDGEFSIITKKSSVGFQKIDDELAKRLEEVLTSNESNFLVGIPKIFSEKDLSNRYPDNKEWCKKYIKETRSDWYKYINFNQIYAAAGFTRNYIGMKDKNECSDYFKKIKGIWQGRDITIIEGEYSRLGINNDLFNDAKSIERILAPAENAFDKYNDILEESKKIDKSRLILIALGPTATVLAFDLYKLGYQAIDIGHLDIEYEWFLQRTLVRTPVKNKYVNEGNFKIKNDNFYDEEYEKQIISKIL